jgi:hypothetical protein
VHRTDGCEYVSQRQVMPLHLRDECDYAEVRCEEEKEGEVCGVTMRRMELKAHQMEVHDWRENKELEESISRNVEEADPEEATEVRGV